MKLWLDTETFSETPIKNGTYRYCEDVEVMILTYAFDDGPVSCADFTAGDPVPRDFLEAFTHPEVELWAHSSMFDRNVIKYGLGRSVPIKRWRDTMVQALSHGLPGGMEKLGEVFKLNPEDAKLKDGRKLIQLFCKPRPKNTKIRRATRSTHPAEWVRFVEYAKQDIITMRALHKVMPTWNYPDNKQELALWHLDQKINDRGFNVDLGLVNGAIGMVELEKEILKDQIQIETDGAVTSATRRDQMIDHLLESHGIYVKDLRKDTLNRMLDSEDIPEPVKELLRIRLAATSTSTSKYASLKRAINDDGRCRGTIQFCGAQRTGRDAGRTFQPQNLPSRGLLPPEEIEWGTACLVDGLPVHDYFDSIMLLGVSCIRGVLIPSEGLTLNVSDLANIEGRYAAWTAEEAWKLEAFSEYDAGLGSDLYILAYARSFRVEPEDVTKEQRNIGKVQELMLQYQGGIGAFVTGAATYGFDIEVLANDIYDTLPEVQIAQAKKYLAFVVKKKLPRYGLSDKAFITCDVLKRLWREAHPMIVSFWSELEHAIASAIACPNKVFDVRDIEVDRRGRWLRIRLQSGRYLCYPSPRLDTEGKISYMGVDQFTRKWKRINGYGGKFFENICQAGARDVLFHSMPAVERQGYEILIRVHDELVTESEKHLTADKLSEIMTHAVSWTEGLPLAAKGDRLDRYRK